MKIKTLSLMALFVITSVLSLGAVLAHAANTDSRIELTAKKSYVFKTYLKDDAIKLRSKGGIVTMTGTVSEESHRSMAEETLNSLPGVKRVDNQLVVAGAPVETSSDAWLGQRVRGTLLFHRSVSYVNTDVSVTDGKVTLSGHASSEAQKQLTTEYAKDISGVKEVDNRMIVTKLPANTERRTGDKIDDASITTQVRLSLLFHHGTDVFDTKVSTNKGIVTLSGTAKNQAEIDLATKRVNDINGVKSVNNQMTIEAVQSSTN